MPTISKVTAQWTGFSGAPGYTNLYYEGFSGSGDATTVTTAARALFQSLVGYLPNNLTIRFTGVYQDLDWQDGSLVGQSSYTAPAAVVGTNTTAYSGLSGATIRWVTSTVVNNRILTGKTFLVPLVGCYDTDGSLAPGFITTLTAATATYVTNAGFATTHAPIVWHRPVAGAGGTFGDITGGVVTDRAAGLRSRRG